MRDTQKLILTEFAKNCYVVKMNMKAYLDSVGPDGKHVVEAILEGVLGVRFVTKEVKD